VPYLAIIGKNGRIIDNLDGTASEKDIVAMLKNAAR
jgi:hypothetical protein